MNVWGMTGSVVGSFLSTTTLHLHFMITKLGLRAQESLLTKVTTVQQSSVVLLSSLAIPVIRAQPPG